MPDGDIYVFFFFFGYSEPRDDNGGVETEVCPDHVLNLFKGFLPSPSEGKSLISEGRLPFLRIPVFPSLSLLLSLSFPPVVIQDWTVPLKMNP